jgi:hypothetical protein
VWSIPCYHKQIVHTGHRPGVVCLVFRPVQMLRVGGLRWIHQHGKISDNRFRCFETGLNLCIAYIGCIFYT